MAYRNRQEFDLRTLINQLDRYFQEMPDIQAGYKTLSRESGDPFVRVSLRKGKDNTNPLYFDIAPTASRGPFPAYLEPSMRTDSPSYYQAEGVIDQSGQTIRTPFEAIAHTVQSAREFSEESIREKGPIAGTSWQDAWGVLRSVGSVEYQIPGSAPRNIETQRESTREDTSQWFAFFVDPSVRTNEADEIIRRRQADPAAGPQGERWWLLQGYGLSSQESSRGGSTVMRFKPVVPGGDPSPLAPVSADKRRSIGFGLGGTREEATVLTTDPSDPTKMIPLQPQLITGMEDHERGGYRWLNAMMPGETERRKVLVRPHTAVRSGTTVPGAVLDYQDPFMGQAAGAGIKSTAKPSVSMPEGNIPGYLKAKFWWKDRKSVV